MSHHRDNSKIEGLVRSRKERLKQKRRLYWEIIAQGCQNLFAMRMNLSQTGKSPYEKYTGVEPKTIKKLVMNRKRSNSDIPEFQLT